MTLEAQRPYDSDINNVEEVCPSDSDSQCSNNNGNSRLSLGLASVVSVVSCGGIIEGLLYCGYRQYRRRSSLRLRLRDEESAARFRGRVDELQRRYAYLQVLEAQRETLDAFTQAQRRFAQNAASTWIASRENRLSGLPTTPPPLPIYMSSPRRDLRPPPTVRRNNSASLPAPLPQATLTLLPCPRPRTVPAPVPPTTSACSSATPSTTTITTTTTTIATSAENSPTIRTIV